MKKYQLIITLIIVVAALIFVFHGVDLKLVYSSIVKADYLLLLYAMLLIFISYIFRIIRWYYLVRPIKKVPLKKLAGPLFLGFASNIIPARAGEFIRAYLLSKKEDLSFSASLGTVFIERLFDVTVLLFFISITFYIKSDKFNFSFTLKENTYQLSEMIQNFGISLIFLFLLLVVFCVLLITKKDFLLKFIRKILKPFSEKVSIKIVSIIEKFSTGLHILKNWKDTLIVIFFSFLIWIFIFYINYPLFQAFLHEPFSIWLPIIASLISAIFVAAFPTPGFLGAYQAAFTITLTNIFNYPKEVSAAIGIVGWVVMMLPLAISALFFIFYEQVSIKDFKKINEKQ